MRLRPPLAEPACPPRHVADDEPDLHQFACHVVFDSIIRYDASFVDSLHRVVPWLERDRLMIG